MSNYYVPSEDGNLYLSDLTELSSVNMQWVSASEITGTISDPDPIWSSGRMKMEFYNFAGDKQIKTTDSDGHTGVYTMTTTYEGIFAYTREIDGVTMLYIGYNGGSTYNDCIQRIQNGTGNFYLFSGSLDDAISSGIVTLPTDWEDNTDPDYDPSQSQGGGNANLGEIETDDIMDSFDLPYEPEDALSHTNVRMMQPYLLTSSQWLQLGYLFWQNADQNTSFFYKLKELMSNGAVDPMTSIANLIRLPVSSGVIATSGSAPIYLGSLAVEGTGGASATGLWISNRFSRIQYRYTIKEVFGTDYDYTKCDIGLYLPYVAQIQLDTAEVMNSTLTVSYVLDVYTGDLTCTVSIIKSMYGKSINSIIGRYKGNCALPMFYTRGDTQSNTQNIFNGMMSYAGAIAGNNVDAGVSALGNTLMNQRVQVQKGGSISGSSGWMDIQYPYLIFKRNVPLYADNWRGIKGAQQHATFTVGSLSGYTEFEEIHVHIPSATDDEQKEIENILKSGVII